ncbi:uncharacterized, partial [Tachysurus ichikawai]
AANESLAARIKQQNKLLTSISLEREYVFNQLFNCSGSSHRVSVSHSNISVLLKAINCFRMLPKLCLKTDEGLAVIVVGFAKHRFLPSVGNDRRVPSSESYSLPSDYFCLIPPRISEFLRFSILGSLSAKVEPCERRIDTFGSSRVSEVRLYTSAVRRGARHECVKEHVLTDRSSPALIGWKDSRALYCTSSLFMHRELTIVSSLAVALLHSGRPQSRR